MMENTAETNNAEEKPRKSIKMWSENLQRIKEPELLQRIFSQN